MDRYPLRPKNEKEAKGGVLFGTALKWCNEAFFDGFIAAHMETPEEYEAITTENRTAFMLAAVSACRVIRREPPPDDLLSLFSGGGTESNPYSLQAVTAHCSGREGGLEMIGKYSPQELITPEEAIALFEYGTIAEMYTAKALFDIYRQDRKSVV